jgi:Asp-tRNAAsn/Glu-tRNAGln amidotransferase B subunit (PET112 homolog)
MPDMPWVLKERFCTDWGLSVEDASVLTEWPGLARYMEGCVRCGANPLRAANWIRTEILRVLNERKIPIEKFTVSPENFSALLTKVEGGDLSTTLAKKVFDLMVSEGLSLPAAIVRLGANSGKLARQELKAVMDRVLERETSAIEEIRTGKDPKGKKRGFLCGQVMREARGQADPGEVAKMLGEILDNQ